MNNNFSPKVLSSRFTLKKPIIDYDDLSINLSTMRLAFYLMFFGEQIEGMSPQIIKLNYKELNEKGLRDKVGFYNAISYFIDKGIIKKLGDRNSLYEINIDYLDRTNEPH